MMVTRDDGPMRGCVIGLLISSLMIVVAALAAYGAYEFVSHVYR